MTHTTAPKSEAKAAHTPVDVTKLRALAVSARDCYGGGAPWERYFDVVRKPAAVLALLDAHLDMLAALYECEEYLASQSDVVDGDDGEPEANAAMALLRGVQDVIRKATPIPTEPPGPSSCAWNDQFVER